MTPEESEKWFEKYGQRSANIGLTSVKPDVTVEDIYQAFKARMESEKR